MVLVIGVAAKVFGQSKMPRVVKPIISGVVFGVVGVVLPLTMFSGSAELTTVLDDANALGVGLVAAIVVGKVLAFAVSSANGFVGGPVFPSLFIGGSAGIVVHLLVPEVPLGLAFTFMLAAVPGALVNAPFSLVLLAARVTQVGALQSAPVLFAVVTAYLTIAGSHFLANLRKRAF